jgi:transposase
VGIGRRDGQPCPSARHEASPHHMGPNTVTTPTHPAIRTHLRDRGIIAVISQPSDQTGHRKRRGSTGGRPPGFDKEGYKGHNVSDRSFSTFKQRRALATRYDKFARTCRGGAILRAISLWLTA